MRQRARLVWALTLAAAGTPACSGKVLTSSAEGLAGSSPQSAASGGSSPGGASSPGGSASAGSGQTQPGSLGGSDATTDPEAPGTLLIPTDGWIDRDSNALAIQGAVFAFADNTSWMSLTSNFTGTNACIAGTAARVDLPCTPIAPATDCYGTYFGAAIGMNLNQSIAPATMMEDTPMPFDASALVGFAFDVSGAKVPAPSDFRFEVETADQQFCNVKSKSQLKIGPNTMLFDALVPQCFKVTDPPPPSAETAKSHLVRIAWHVITNTTTTVPFDFCVSNIRALLR